MERGSIQNLIIVVLVLLSCVLPFGKTTAQEAEWLNENVRLRGGSQSLEQALDQIAQFGISVSYRNDQLPDQLVSIRGRKMSIRSWLSLILRNTELIYSAVGESRSLVIFPDPELVNNSFTLHGNIYDALSGERLILANIYVKNREQGVSSNEYGQYALYIPGGHLELDISYVGYRKASYDLVLRGDSLLDIRLQPDYDLQQIIVTANTDSMIGVNPDAGGIRIGITETEQLSGPGGESDPIQVVSLLPGIVTGADGIGGINIRGSDASQNLILLDGVPVYNLNHAGGLFSIFNSQAIRRVDLYKNGIPARYGGRLSGVVDVYTRDGNLYQNEIRLSQSLLATRVTAEGPLLEGESSYLVSGRGFGAAALVPSISRNYKRKRGREGEARYRLYDLNFKLNHKLGKNDHLYFSFYKGTDELSNNAEKAERITVLGDAVTVFNYDVLQRSALNVSWGNSVGALRWNHAFDDRLFGNIRITYSDLGLRAGFLRQDSLVEISTNVNQGSRSVGVFESDIQQVGFAFDGQWLPRVGREVRFGGQLNFHRFQPLILGSNDTDLLDDDFEFPEAKIYRPTEFNSYMAYVIRKPDLQFRMGVRAQYWYMGDGKGHFSLSPRLLFTRRLSPSLSMQTTFDATAQAVHLLGSATIGLPTDIWVPSTRDIAPSHSYQVSTGLKTSIGKSWDAELAIYGKKMEGLVEYLNKEDLEGNWEDQVSIGEGQAYGAEFTLRRHRGNIRGWITYTRAKTDRKFDTQVNGGRVFPYRYDRKHSISALISWHPTSRSSLTATWRYGTGAAYSFNLSSYNLPFPVEYEEPREDIPITTERNGFRLPPMHRLDLNYRITLGAKPTSKYKHTFDIGLYNAYDRHNEIYYELRTDYDRVRDELIASRSFVKVFIAPLLPIFSYQLHFRGKRNDK